MANKITHVEPDGPILSILHTPCSPPHLASAIGPLFRPLYPSPLRSPSSYKLEVHLKLLWVATEVFIYSFIIIMKEG